MWARFGFVPRGNHPGRGEDQVRLILWRYEKAVPPPLLGLLAQASIRDRLQVVVDANVYFDLVKGSDPQAEESRALQADWLDDVIVLCVTPEMRREAWRGGLLPGGDISANGLFFEVETTGDHWQEVHTQVEALMPPARTDQDESDRRQLAHAIAGGAHFFATRDDEILKQAQAIEERFPIRVLRPVDVILALDEEQRALAYAPARLMGTRITNRRVAANEREAVVRRFQRFTQRESKADWLKRLDELLIAPHDYEVHVVETDGESLLLVGLDRRQPGRLSIALLRAAGPQSPTALRGLLIRLLEEGLTAGRPVIECIDLGDPIVDLALADLGFRRTGEGAVKLMVPWVTSVAELPGRLRGQFSDVETGSLESPPEHWEQAFWPLKLEDLPRPHAYLVPIRPYWAQHLFDARLAEEDLFGARPELAFHLENVYYRAAKPAVLEAPGWILWYISDGTHHGARRVRACSHLDEVEVGPAHALYRKYRRLGVYEWPQILKTARGKPQKPIMALRFSQTESFRNPISWKRTQEILARYGKPNQLQGPLRISAACFIDLYRAGRGD